MGDLTGHVQDLVRGEVELVKTEAVDNAKRLAVYVGMAVGAGVLGAAALMLLGHMLAQALVPEMPNWLAYLIVTLLYAGIATALAVAAKKGIADQEVAPTESIGQAKEDLQWIKQHR
jgi:hypothetical protein